MVVDVEHNLLYWVNVASATIQYIDLDNNNKLNTVCAHLLLSFLCHFLSELT